MDETEYTRQYVTKKISECGKNQLGRDEAVRIVKEAFTEAKAMWPKFLAWGNERYAQKGESSEVYPPKAGQAP